jgi:hypothetical protein
MASTAAASSFPQPTAPRLGAARCHNVVRILSESLRSEGQRSAPVTVWGVGPPTRTIRIPAPDHDPGALSSGDSAYPLSWRPLLAVHQRLGPHQEHRPTRPWEQPAERCEQRTVLGLQTRAVDAGGAAPPARDVAPRSRSPWPPLTGSSAGPAQGCGAAPGRRTTRPQQPPPTKASKRRRIVVVRQVAPGGDGHDRLLALHGPRRRMGQSCAPQFPSSRLGRGSAAPIRLGTEIGSGPHSVIEPTLGW